MNDLISRQAAYDTLTEYYHQRTETQHEALREALSRVPTIDPVKRGLWKKHPIDSDWDVCSYCGMGTRARFHYNEGVYGGYDEEVSYSYCPNCGAKMERSEE